MESLDQVVRERWGFDSLRPLQAEAMRAAVEGRDSLVVLPTGGGKSLCYQAPALVSGRPTVVVSPLISLMKDQVDRLLARGIPAAFLNSSLEAADRGRVNTAIARGEYRIVFVAPERFAAEGFFSVLRAAKVGAFAIDEAHCISHWGHDFRADYRKLGKLRAEFPHASLHAFTATAPPRVREDIVVQLGLRDPLVLVGDFFRPNLRYKVERRTDAFEDVLSEIRRHPGGAGIVYCIRRADVDDLAPRLRAEGVKAAGYHAGMSDESRTHVQDRFAAGEVDVVVATVAFGMGIDRADLRFVIHAAMPQSIEHYQQETGRAGRDGKPAECVLYYSGGDYRLWKILAEKGDSGHIQNRLGLLSEMYRFCTAGRCRHRMLVEYFGQAWTRGKCGACDLCENERPALPEATEVARRILACISRTGQRYGAGYIADLLTGTATDRVMERGHAGLAEFGAMSTYQKSDLVSWMHQLADQELLRREGEYGVLRVTAKGAAVLQRRAEASLSALEERRPRRRRKRVVPADPIPSENRVSEGLYERLRILRRRIAAEDGIPAFMVFSDKTLRHIAHARPTTEGELLEVHGVGPRKAERYGGRVLAVTTE